MDQFILRLDLDIEADWSPEELAAHAERWRELRAQLEAIAGELETRLGVEVQVVHRDLY